MILGSMTSLGTATPVYEPLEDLIIASIYWIVWIEILLWTTLVLSRQSMQFVLKIPPYVYITFYYPNLSFTKKPNRLWTLLISPNKSLSLWNLSPCVSPWKSYQMCLTFLIWDSYKVRINESFSLSSSGLLLRTRLTMITLVY